MSISSPGIIIFTIICSVNQVSAICSGMIISSFLCTVQYSSYSTENDWRVGIHHEPLEYKCRGNVAEGKAGKSSILVVKPVPPPMIKWGSSKCYPKRTRASIMTWTRRVRRLLGKGLEPGKDKGSSKLTTASRLELLFHYPGVLYTRAELVKVKPIHAANHGERFEYPAVRIKYPTLCFFLNRLSKCPITSNKLWLSEPKPDLMEYIQILGCSEYRLDKKKSTLAA